MTARTHHQAPDHPHREGATRCARQQPGRVRGRPRREQDPDHATPSRRSSRSTSIERATPGRARQGCAAWARLREDCRTGRRRSSPSRRATNIEFFDERRRSSCHGHQELQADARRRVATTRSATSRSSRKDEARAERSLEHQTATGGRNNHGRITSRFRGGGHKQRYRIIDFKRDKIGVPGEGRRDRVRSEPHARASRSCTTPTARSATSSRPTASRSATRSLASRNADIKPGNTPAAAATSRSAR